MPRPTSTCHIGVAFYTLHNFPIQWAIVLSANESFQGSVICGTTIHSVKGWSECWYSCFNSPATFAPHMSLLGIIYVAKVDMWAWDVCKSISGSYHARHVHHSDSDDAVDEAYPSDEYVRRSILHLSRELPINLPAETQSNLAEHIEARLSKLREAPGPLKHNYPIIPILEEGIVF